MGRVGALPPSGFEPSAFPTSLQKQIQQTLFSISLDQARAKFGEDSMVEARSAEFKAERIFPGQPITHRISSLAIRQPFHKLKHGHQCQPPRGQSGLTMGRKEVSKCLVGVDGSQCVTHLYENISTRKDCVSHTNYFFWNRRNRQSFE